MTDAPKKIWIDDMAYENHWHEFQPTPYGPYAHSFHGPYHHADTVQALVEAAQESTEHIQALFEFMLSESTRRSSSSGMAAAGRVREGLATLRAALAPFTDTQEGG